MVTGEKISVVIPLFNGSPLISRALDSVFSQETSSPIEVIVVDDGSTDDSVKIVNNYPQLVLLFQQENQGPAAARNKGIKAATGKYLAFLDADDYWEPDFLSNSVFFMEEHPEAVAVSTGQLHKIPGKPDSVSPAILRNDSQINENGILLHDFFSFWKTNNHICTGAVLMRTNIVKESGGLRNELLVTEDLEFWLYLSTFGPFGFIPKVLFVSDGGIVTKKIGWLTKNKKRWNSAPTVEYWSARILKKLPDRFKESFKSAQGRIARNLSYSMMLSQRTDLARNTILTYGYLFPCDKMSRLMVLASKRSMFIFDSICKLLLLREFIRAKRISI